MIYIFEKIVICISIPILGMARAQGKKFFKVETHYNIYIVILIIIPFIIIVTIKHHLHHRPNHHPWIRVKEVRKLRKVWWINLVLLREGHG